MSDKSKRGPKRGPLLRTDKKDRQKPKRNAPQTPVAAEEDPRGKFLFCMGKKVRLIKCEHYELPPSLEYTPDGQPVNFLRHTCSLEVETVPPNRFVRSMLYYILKGEIKFLPSGKLSIPEWATPYEIKMGVVIDVYGGEWVMESFHEDVVKLEDQKSEKQEVGAPAGGCRQTGPATQAVADPEKGGRKPLSKKQISARRKGGESRALIEKRDEAKILARWNKCPKGFSKNSKAEVVAKWCDTEGLLRKDGDRITPRNILEFVRRRIEKKPSK